MRGLCLNVLIIFSLMVFVSCSDDNADPDGHFKIPHLWPPQNPPPVKVAV